MEIYLVGGAVRDALLGLPVNERDWVVVGATLEEMLALGFQPVGKDFPVFLHPKTHEEYALARTERKIAQGYKGFEFYCARHVTLEQDLLRRDLTINAIAQASDGTLVDPFGGQTDLGQRCLRHVSAAFAEDPVRILRVARFAAKFPDFTVYPATVELMQAMVAAGEVAALVAERVWQEFKRALAMPAPVRFIEVLAGCGALAILFPNIQFDKAALEKACRVSPIIEIRFAALLHATDAAALQALVVRYRLPREVSELALLVINNKSLWQSLLNEFVVSSSFKDAAGVLQLLKQTDALRRGERFTQFLLASSACLDSAASVAILRLQDLRDQVKQIDNNELLAQGLKGQAFAAALHDLQIARIKSLNLRA